ncbi:hypothetical protein [Anaerotruncus sp. AF02-27]|uniref:hypothetical protein n=1 Tax=Anaerotruncus sp. AF02-27 TaxID=2292191 RepID=UPI0011C2179F|nr:hypothetical protein [Anaerotruncus sp. AF02-27]
MTQKKEMPARSGNYEASTAINEQLHSTIPRPECKELKVRELLAQKPRYAELVLAMAENNLNLTLAAQKSFYSSNAFYDRNRRLVELTGYDCRKFYDVLAMLWIIEELQGGKTL